MTFGESLLEQMRLSPARRWIKAYESWLLPMVEQAVKDERAHRAAVIGTPQEAALQEAANDVARLRKERGTDWQEEHFGKPPIPAGLNAAYIDHPHQFHPAMHASVPFNIGLTCSDCRIDSEPCPTCYSIYWAKKHSTNHTSKETP
jgi:hypothetical protein